MIAATMELAGRSTQFDKLGLPADLQRKFRQFKTSLSLLAPSDASAPERVVGYRHQHGQCLRRREVLSGGLGRRLQEPGRVEQNHGRVPQPRRTARRLDRLAHHLAADAQRSTNASSSWPTPAPRSSAFRISANCGAPDTTCRSAGIRRRSRSTLAAGSSRCTSALHCHVRARLSSSVRQGRRPPERPDPGPPAGEHVEPELAQHL